MPESWSIRNRGNAAARDELSAAVLEHAAQPIAEGRPLLDVGCGTGWLLESLAGAGADPAALHGIEADPTRAEAARARAPGATVEVGDAARLPYRDATFGLVALIVVLSSLPREEVGHALAEVRRVLSPGGVLLIYEPRLPNPLNPATHVVRRRDLDRAGLVPRTERNLTLLPPVGRRLGALTARLHPLLTRVPVLRSHRLIAYRPPAP